MGWVSGERRTSEETAEWAVPPLLGLFSIPVAGRGEGNHQRRFVDAHGDEEKSAVTDQDEVDEVDEVDEAAPAVAGEEAVAGEDAVAGEEAVQAVAPSSATHAISTR